MDKTKEIEELLKEAQKSILNNPPRNTAEVLREAQKLAAFAYIIDAVHFYRQLGFYAATPEISDADFAQRLIARVRIGIDEREMAWFAPEHFLQAQRESETLFLLGDGARVWSSDLELDVCEGNHSYAVFLRELSAISRGLFVPENIIEVWNDAPTQTLDHSGIKVEIGGIHIAFTCGSRKFSFEPTRCEDWLCVPLALKAINESLSPTGYQFEWFGHEDLTGIVLLSAPEKKLLAQKRAFPFVHASDLGVWNADEYDPFELD